MKLPYREGSVFLVPLRDGGHGRGVVARAAPKGRGLFGYFFGPRLTSTDSVPSEDLSPSKAILRVRFGDLGLISGQWQICGSVPRWDRSEWSMPGFVRKDPLGKRKPALVIYSDTDPLRIEVERQVYDNSGLESDSAYGYGAVEIALTKLLKEAEPPGRVSP